MSSIFGFLLGVVCVAVAQILDGGALSALIQPTAAVVVIGGTLAATLTQFSWPTVWAGARLLQWVWKPPQNHPMELARNLLVWSQQARREGLLVLDRQSKDIQDPFLRRGLELLVDGVSPAHMEAILKQENTQIFNRHQLLSRVWESAGHYAPTIGILGAVLGLIHVMNNLADPEQLGQGIATAFVATIYGVGLANLALLPLARKLNTEARRLASANEMLTIGLVSIANGETPRATFARLRGFFTADEEEFIRPSKPADRQSA